MSTPAVPLPSQGTGKKKEGLWPRGFFFASSCLLFLLAGAHAWLLPPHFPYMEKAEVQALPVMVEIGVRIALLTKHHWIVCLGILVTLGLLVFLGKLDRVLRTGIVLNLVLTSVLLCTLCRSWFLASQYG
jgi:hypothetical protein